MDKDKVKNPWFGSYEKSNWNVIKQYMSYIEEYVEKEYPHRTTSFDGVERFSYFKYLENKQLNAEPENVENVFADIVKLFRGLPIWSHPGTMLNVIPPANLPAVAMNAYLSMYNPNLSQDRYSGLLLTAELEAVKYMNDLIGWNWKEATGTFTFGGKGTNLYGMKCALNKAYPEGKEKGYFNKDFFFISSGKGHPCHEEVVDWLGIGKNSCIKAKCAADGKIIVSELEGIIDENIQIGRIFLGFNLSGGSTVEYEVDDIKEIAKVRDEIVKKYELDYFPHIHVDSVVGWLWLFYNQYDYINNKLHIEIEILEKIKELNHDIAQIKYADSCGIDFHKTGFTPYITSLFLVKNRRDYYNLGTDDAYINVEDLEYGNYSPFEQTLELTRSCCGPISALTTLKTFGIEGYQKIIYRLMQSAKYFRTKLSELPYIEIINPDTKGIATLFIIKPADYINNSLQEILNMEKKDTDKIKKYNLDFANFTDLRNTSHEISVMYTASDVFCVNNTNVCLGSIKAYPMTPLTNMEAIDLIIKEIIETKNIFDNTVDLKLTELKHKPKDMVYKNIVRDNKHGGE